MTDYALVINAGSSSLKFCVFARPDDDWRLESRGQIDGIGSSPRIVAKDGEGQVLVDRKPHKVHDGRDALPLAPARAASRAARLNGFRRLAAAPSLVAIPRKSGPEAASDAIGRPEITMMGISGRRC